MYSFAMDFIVAYSAAGACTGRHANPGRVVAYSVMLSQDEPSWSKQRLLAVRVGTPEQALYASTQPSNTGPSEQLPHTSSSPASPPQAATRTSSPTTEIRIKIDISPPPDRLMDRTGVVKVG